MGEQQIQGQGSKASVTAHFTLSGGSGEQTADATAELIRRLQEMANLPQCAYELDIDIEWPSAAAKSSAAPGQGLPSPGSRSSSR